ncbi:MAG: nucleotide pyrophosphohydrolase [Gemmatimonadetes bacterium]|nr:MAG: nucleotide pyrophosphohydrolase [Gemmatimonadota bacterium]PYO64971.1 MAG: nucleotide pyrophosphohydrolase [Gemmatimonadota bacterium]PYO86378.1 MAG: nucleotide pyrophosphohydrolase [Gemmatimonadota bacterium]PYP61930.1 MAG: nucleotide pyrophosphohydrolase [Gemmatimonadota bacterium]
MSFRDAQQAVDRWIGQYKEGYFPPLTSLARLTEEVGELAREINHRFGEKPKKAGEAEGSLALELADIVFVVICLANSQGIDLDEAFAAMMQKVRTRDDRRWTKK